jgi:hypothetical protein
MAKAAHRAGAKNLAEIAAEQPFSLDKNLNPPY